MKIVEAFSIDEMIMSEFKGLCNSLFINRSVLVEHLIKDWIKQQKSIQSDLLGGG